MRSRSAGTLLLTLLAASACGDAAGPRPEPQIAFQAFGHTSGPPAGSAPWAGAVRCNYTLTVQATGDAGASARLTRIILYYNVAHLPDAAMDSLVLNPSEIPGVFRDELRPGDVRTAEWTLTSPNPFVVTTYIRFRTPSGQTGGVSTPQGAGCRMEPAS